MDDVVHPVVIAAVPDEVAAPDVEELQLQQVQLSGVAGAGPDLFEAALQIAEQLADLVPGHIEVGPLLHGHVIQHGEHLVAEIQIVIQGVDLIFQGL